MNSPIGMVYWVQYKRYGTGEAVGRESGERGVSGLDGGRALERKLPKRISPLGAAGFPGAGAGPNIVS